MCPKIYVERSGGAEYQKIGGAELERSTPLRFTDFEPCLESQLKKESIDLHKNLDFLSRTSSEDFCFTLTIMLIKLC